jgi:2,3-bisphosphoglycerate-dependent phosphoglycerate mutase
MRTFLAALLLIASSGSAFGQNPVLKNSGHIFVVRHSEKESEDADALSARGKARAACLASTLKDANIKTIITSQFNRSQQTAGPTAEEFKLQVLTFKADDYPSILNKAQDATAKGDVLIVGHSNTVPQMVEMLSRVPVTVNGNDYDQLFLIDNSGVTQLHFCPSTLPEPESRMK